MTDLAALERDLLGQVEGAPDEAALEALRVSALGKKGAVSDLLKTLGAMTPDERKEKGPLINGLRDKVQGAIATRREALAEAALEQRLAAERIDVSLPVREGPETRGRIHPISQVMDELTAIFADMGFSVAEGPDIETDFYNFTALNFPPGHPAREMHDTFFLQPDHKGERKVLRTHTSPVQIRTMLTSEPPIRVICPGRTYRHDFDQTHTPMFHQVEGLVIDKHATIAHMKWVLEEFCKAFFEVESVKMRFRPVLLPVHRALGRGRHPVLAPRRRDTLRRGRRLARDPRLRHGASERAAELQARSGCLPGLRLGHGHRPHRDAQIRHAGSAAVLRGRCALAGALRVPAAGSAEPRRRADRVSCDECEFWWLVGDDHDQG